MVVERWCSIRISGPQLSDTWEFLSSSILGHDEVQIVTGSQCEVPGLTAGQYMRDSSWTKCYWDRFLSEHFSFLLIIAFHCRSQWPRGLRRRSAAARLLKLWVRLPSEAWMSVCCECCVLSVRGLCDGLITRPEKSYRLWCVVECDLETS